MAERPEGYQLQCCALCNTLTANPDKQIAIICEDCEPAVRRLTLAIWEAQKKAMPESMKNGPNPVKQ